MGLPLAAAVVAAVLSLIVPARYSASVSVAPGTQRGTQLPGALAGLAGQFGLNLTTDAVQSPGFYIQVLQSRELLEAVLETPYPVPGAAGDSAALLDILRVKGQGRLERLGRGVVRLRNMMAASADNQTGIVRLQITTRDPGLSAQVARRFVAVLNEFNLRRGQEQARDRREFIESRLADAARALRAAEDSLFQFLQTNRVYQSSPELQFAYGRLQRQVDIRQNVYLTLSQAYEDARIQEVNDVPVITVVDSAEVPWRRSYPGRRVWVVMAFVMGLAAAVTAAVVANYVDDLRRADPARSQEVLDLWRRARLKLRLMVTRERAEAPRT